jgi:hypothetical protein
MFADEARFGRMNRPRPCWAPVGIRPKVASQLIREYIYLYGAVTPKDGTCVYLIMPTSNTACFQAFLDVLSRKFARQDILLVLDGAPNHRSGQLAAIPAALFAGTQSKGKSVGRNPRKNLQELRPQINQPRATEAPRGNPLRRAQPRRGEIHRLIPIHRKVTLIWKRYNTSYST